MALHTRKNRPGQLLLALVLLYFFVSIDAPFPWSTPLYYELGFDVEPWHGPEGLDRARADLTREGLSPRSIELTWTFTLLACQGGGCNIAKTLRATFAWPEVSAALERCFSYNPLHLSRTTAVNRKDCRADLYVREQAALP